MEHDSHAKLKDATRFLTQQGAPFEVVEEVLDGVPYRLFRNAPRTLRELFAPGRAHGQKTFLVYEGENWSFDDFFRQSDAMAHQLWTKHKIRKGDRVAIAMRNYPEWMTAFVAIGSLGATVVPLNSWGQGDELEYELLDSGAKLVFCDQTRIDSISDRLAASRIQGVVVRPTRDQQADGVLNLEQFLAGAEGTALPEVDVDPEQPATILYTSGTTGKPKGALSCQRAVTQAVFSFEFAATASAMANQELIGKMLARGYEQSVLLAVPLFHVSGCYAMFLLSLRAGRKIVMMYKWDVRKALDYIEKERITSFSLSPSMIADLLGSAEFERCDMSSLFGVGSGGSAQPSFLSKLIYQKLPESYPGTGYGLTESNAVGTSLTGALYKARSRSSGVLNPIVDLKICDQEGRELSTGEDGEIWLRSPTLIREYWNLPEDTARTLQDGWLATGDVGHLDAEGFLFVTDRIKDMVIRGGENIYSAEIESAAYEVPGVLEAVAFGVPHDTLGEELALAVRPKPEAHLSEKELRIHLEERLAAYKVPAYIFLREEPLPQNASGKILKKAIRADYLRRLGIG